MRKIMAVAILASVVGFATNATAQARKLAVAIDATADDPIGRQLVFYLRDTIGQSGIFTEVNDKYDKGFKLEIVTLDPLGDRQGAGTMTVYSMAILARNNGGWDYFLTNYVGICSVPKPCAQRLFGALGEQAERIRALVSRRAQ